MAHTLLLADDSVTIQRVVELTFAGEDIRIVAVGNGQQAIDRLSDDPPDIVLADIGMPLLDGYAVASFVKNHDALRDVPVLLMVGAFDPVDEDRVQASGASGVLVKPFEPTLVISRVKELLGLGPHPAEKPAEKLVVTPAAPPAPEAPAAATKAAAAPASAPSAVADFESDWLPQDSSERLRARLAERPESSDVPPSPVEALWAKEAAAVAPPPPPAPSAPAPAPATSMADAFSALLAAEQGEPVAVPSNPAAHATPNLDAIVDRVTARVIEQLGTAAVRERADRIVLEVAERLVREEIARIRETATTRHS